MATLVRCLHCDKEFQGNAMRIRAHLLGTKRQAGVTGCPTVPDEAREELRLIEMAREQTQKKRKPLKTSNHRRGTSSASDHSSGSAEHALTSGRKGDRHSSQHELLLRMVRPTLTLHSFSSSQSPHARKFIPFWLLLESKWQSIRPPLQNEQILVPVKAMLDIP